jgi:hypothetical protein
MKPLDENTPISDDQQFDLLVDGELDESRRRELLCRLDEEPAGWRRCALAFLEAQSWRQACGSLAGGPAGEPPTRRRARWFRPSGPVGTLLAMAASFVAALVLIWHVQGIWRAGVPTGSAGIGSLALEEALQTPGGEPAAPQTDQPSSPQAPESVPGKVYLVELPGGTGPEGQPQTIRVPVVERDRVAAEWLESLPAPISADLLEQFRQAGYRVEQRREVIPLKTNDGRRLLLPVDEVDVHYVGNSTF